MSHTCHWPGCPKEVPPKLWGCAKHWFTLPKRLRDAIYATYVPGQEITKTPSPLYLEIAHEVQDWCDEYIRVQTAETLKFANQLKALD